MTQKNLKKLINVAPENRCGLCGFFTTDSIENEICVNIDANKEYDMTDLSENTVCQYHSKDGYICETCGAGAETMFIIYPESNKYKHLVYPENNKYIHCEECIGKRVKSYAHDIENNKVEIIVVSKDIN